MLREIVARCTRAQQLLDAQEQRFDELRDLEASAPAQLAALPAAIEALRTRCTAADAGRGPPRRHVRPVRDASVTATSPRRPRPSMPRPARRPGGPRWSGTKPTEGVVALRRAQEAMARATQLVEAVERLAAGLDEAAARLPAELDAAARDVGRGPRRRRRAWHQVPAVPPSAPGSAAAADPVGALRAAEAALGEARRAAEARPLDPLAALQRAMAANQAADAIVAQVADANAQVARRRQVAEAAIATAQGHVGRAIDYITTRRHGVGRDGPHPGGGGRDAARGGARARGHEPRGRDRDGQSGHRSWPTRPTGSPQASSRAGTAAAARWRARTARREPTPRSSARWSAASSAP